MKDANFLMKDSLASKLALYQLLGWNSDITGLLQCGEGLRPSSLRVIS
jgi:hypothetical protein